MLYFSFQKLEIYIVSKKKQYLNNIYNNILTVSTTNLMKVCLCLYIDKIWFKVVYMLYFSFQKLEIYIASIKKSNI